MSRIYGNTVDLTHTITGNIPVFPGDAPPGITRHCTFEKDGFAETRLDISSHTGTHIDAPAHMMKDGKYLDDFPLDSFTGRAVVADVSGKAHMYITSGMLEPLEKYRGKIDYILLKTGWGSLWDTGRYLEGFPSLDREAASMLASFGLKGIGTDTISIDRMESDHFEIHRIFMERNILIIENLANLDKAGPGIFTFFCAPLKLAGSDGSPVRAFAIKNP